MAFKPYDTSKRKPQLVSLIDMAFLLLLFFLVTSLVAQLSKQEQKLAIPTPENKSGRAQILIQFLSENEFLYIDQTTNRIVQAVKDEFGFESPGSRRRRIVNRILTNKKCNKAEIIKKLTGLKKIASDHPDQQYFILIRCPKEIYYYHVLQLVQFISGLPNVTYGCVGGTVADIRNATDIYLRSGKDSHGKKRENLVILFPK